VSAHTVLSGAWAACASHAGGVATLADEWGITRQTLHAWATGANVPQRLVRSGVNAWAKRRGLEEPFG
jgi:hypothetical protein